MGTNPNLCNMQKSALIVLATLAQHLYQSSKGSFWQLKISFILLRSNISFNLCIFKFKLSLSSVFSFFLSGIFNSNLPLIPSNSSLGCAKDRFYLVWWQLGNNSAVRIGRGWCGNTNLLSKWTSFPIASLQHILWPCFMIVLELLWMIRGIT